MNEERLNQPVKVTLFCQNIWDDGWIPEKLVDAIPWLQKFLDQAPKKYRDQVTIEISADEYRPEIDISYQRPVTGAEKQDRLMKEQQQIKRRTVERRQQYERLKAEFDE